MPEVSIVMPLYNKAGTVGRAVESILNQTFTDWQLIVVDDGSTDNSAEIVGVLGDGRIELIRQSNQGPGAARNAGIAAARGKYLAFLDADDEWYRWYLANAVEAITNNDVSLVGTTFYEWPKKMDMTGHWAKRGIRFGKYQMVGNENPKWVESLILFFHVGNSLLRTDVAGKYGGFYDKGKCKTGEDTFFFMRIVINEPVMVTGPAAVRHHREESDLSNVLNHPLAPIFTEPEQILDSCTEERRGLMRKVIARLALRTAHHKARNGFKKDAVELLRRFPDSKEYRLLYYRCRCEIALSGVLPYWARFRCAVGPPVRLFVKSLAWRLRLSPKIPDVTEGKNTDGTEE